MALPLHPSVTLLTLLAVCVAIMTWPAAEAATNTKAEAKVIILGAGLAGVSAAKSLSDSGIDDFIIIEGSDRVGGRLKEAVIGGYTVEIGNQLIQGTYAAADGGNNPILDLAVKYSLSYEELDYEDWTVRNKTGTDITDLADVRYESFYEAYEKAYDLSQRMLEGGKSTNDQYKPDTNFKSSLLKYGWEIQSHLDGAIEFFDIDFEIGHEPDVSSTRFFYNYNLVDYEDTDLFVTQQGEGGFSKIAKSLLDEVLDETEQRLYLNQVVTQVSQEDSEVVVTTASGERFAAEYVILTFSLGVLQSNSVEFLPQLPEWKLDSINQFSLGLYATIILRFPAGDPARFWDDSEWIMITNGMRAYMSLWQDLDKFYPGSNLLQCIVTGDEARRLESLSDDEVQEEAMASLRKIYGATIPDPEEILFPRWGSDPLYRGSFSNWPPAYESWQKAALQEPIDRLFFAGEAYHDRTFGYAQSAFQSGEKVGKTIANCLANGCVREEFVPPYNARGCTYEDADNYDNSAQEEDGSCAFSTTSGTGCHVLSPFLMLLVFLFYTTIASN